ncbi:MAG: hypothetical protein KUG75_05565 [Pseudomonadales bacterium]|nr:hypothetical protein [Pseudomonadales bacterium]
MSGNYTKMSEIPMEALGGFLEGAFAPLAFLWLVIGLFIQQKELADNTEVLRKTSIQSEKQTQAIAATELNARQETFFKIAENVRRQLGTISGMLFISCMGATEGSKVAADTLSQHWQTFSTGDYELFSRLFLTLDEEIFGGYEILFFSTEIRLKHADHFCHTFERLMRLAQNCDTDGIISDSLTQTGHGLMYSLMQRTKASTQITTELSQVGI